MNKEGRQKRNTTEEVPSDGESDDMTQNTTGKGKKAFSFALLMDDEDERSSEEEPEDFVAVPEPKKKGGKEKGRKKDKKQLKEKDLDDVVAGIENVTLTPSSAPPDLSKMTQDEMLEYLDQQYDDAENQQKKKKKENKKKQKAAKAAIEKEEDELLLSHAKNTEDETVTEGGSSVKTEAQKKKEKKERQKLKKQQAKEGAAEVKQEEKEEPKADAKTSEAAVETDDTPVESASQRKKREREERMRGKKKEEKKPSKLAQKIREEQAARAELEKKIRKEEEEKMRKEEEARRAREEAERVEKEKKEREKQKKKDRIARQKAEGTYLTPKERQQRARQLQMIEALGLAGKDDDVVEKPKTKRPIYTKKKKPPQKQQLEEVEAVVDAVEEVEEAEVQEKKSATKEQPAVDIDVEEPVASAWDEEDKPDDEQELKDSWDAEEEVAKEPAVSQKKQVAAEKNVVAKTDDVSDDEGQDDHVEEESSEEEESESSSDDDDMTPAERARDKAQSRIRKRKQIYESMRTTDNLRCPVVVVLGHVDTGKTKILDKLRRTNVQEGEAGGITQQIGATNVPRETIQEQTKMCKEFAKNELKIPGLLIIDTPGHESFSNLRLRGSSLCDIAILVVDIMHGLEKQTIESINILRDRKTPFIIAINKVDQIYQWQTNPHGDILNTIKKQKTYTKQQFDDRVAQVTVEFAEQGLNVCLWTENKNHDEYYSMVPTSAHTGDGMGNLVAALCEYSQTFLPKRLAFSNELQATVMEVKEIKGMGVTIDVILVNGRLKEGDSIIVAGSEGPIVTQIRSLNMPQPLRELRVKNAYEHHKEVVAAQGVKLACKDLEKCLAGLPVLVANQADEIPILREEMDDMLQNVLGSIKLSERGVYVQASTLGSLEALLDFLKSSKIPYAGINIGPVHKRDIMKSSVMLEHDTQWAVVLAFDVKVEREAQEMADGLGIRIFTADIIYHLFDAFMKHREELKRKKQEELKHVAVFPCKLRILPQFVFNSRDPIVVGVVVEAGLVKVGTPVCVPAKEFVDIGRIVSIEVNNKSIEVARKGQEVCIKIDPTPGDAPKMVGRHFEITDLLVSKISRPSIDAVKDWFRDDMTKGDWQLIVELKKTFQIL